MKLYFRLPLALSWAGLILVLTLSPLTAAESSQVAEPFDKFIHAGLFAVLAGLTAWSLWPKARLDISLLAGGGISLIYSFFIEYWQQFIPGRSSSWGDFFAGAAGIFLASMIIYYVKSRKA
ncbi:MAG: VanZ family protein [Planctomycetes bacterium]|jgi:VanZ family protein|nr:VanZ family protein [Planctomycetota bacterium]